jgi:hypothetical protein
LHERRGEEDAAQGLKRPVVLPSACMELKERSNKRWVYKLSGE